MRKIDTDDELRANQLLILLDALPVDWMNQGFFRISTLVYDQNIQQHLIDQGWAVTDDLGISLKITDEGRERVEEIQSIAPSLDVEEARRLLFWLNFRNMFELRPIPEEVIDRDTRRELIEGGWIETGSKGEMRLSMLAPGFGMYNTGPMAMVPEEGHYIIEKQYDAPRRRGQRRKRIFKKSRE